MVTLDIRDAKTGKERPNSGVWLNEYSCINISVDTIYDPDTKTYKEVKLKEIRLHLQNNTGRKDRNYKIRDNGSVSDRFWESVREHTKTQLGIKAQEDSKVKRIKDNYYKMEEYISVPKMDVDAYYIKQLKIGVCNDAIIKTGDGSVTARFLIDHNGDIKLAQFTVSNRYITVEEFKELLELVGLRKVFPKHVPVSSGEFVDV